MTEFHPGDLVRIKESSKSQYKGAIATVVSHCHGSRSDILLIQLWKNKIVQICESSLQKLPAIELPREDAVIRYKSGFVNGFKKAVKDMHDKMHEKKQWARNYECDMDVVDIDDVDAIAKELMRGVENEDNA